MIMLGLFAASVMVWAVWVAKTRQFKALHRQADDFETSSGPAATRWKASHARLIPSKAGHPLASVFVVGLEEWNAASDEERRDGTALQRARRMMDATARRELESLEAWLPAMATTGSVGPFVGLLGTVWGIMTSFQSIGASKNTSLAVVAPGIAEALFATAIGLFAAIPAVIAYNRLSGSLGRYAAVSKPHRRIPTVLERQATRKANPHNAPLA